MTSTRPQQEPERYYYRGRAGADYAPMGLVRKQDTWAGGRYSPEYEAAVTALLALGGRADRAAASALGQMEPPCGCGCAPHRQARGLAAGWHKHRGPLPALRAAGRGYPQWADHPYRVRGRDGRWTYVAEPYSIHADDLADLACLEAQGWRVFISAEYARHFPGRTTAIMISGGEAP
jgi:hypothetical protein